MRKITVIGAGHVGSTIAYTLATKRIANKIALIDIDERKCKAEVKDIRDAVVDLYEDVTIDIGEYSDLDDSDILIVTAGGAPTDEESADRMQALDESMKIIDIIANNIKQTKFSGIIINIGNPADIVAHRLMQKLNYDQNKVLSTGTYLDSNRLKQIIAERTNVSPKKITAYMFGEHGESQFAAFSLVDIDGKSAYEYFNEDELSEIETKVKARGWSIFTGKGSTEYGVCQAACRLVEEIYDSSDTLMPISVHLNGQFGYNDLHISTLAKLDANGIYDIVEPKLNEDEKKKMNGSIEKLRSVLGLK